MNTDTGELIPVEELRNRTIEEQRKFVEIPDAFLCEINGMNRRQRRIWYRENKKRIKEYRDNGGISDVQMPSL